MIPTTKTRRTLALIDGLLDGRDAPPDGTVEFRYRDWDGRVHSIRRDVPWGESLLCHTPDFHGRINLP